MGESQMLEMTHIVILVKVTLIDFFVPKIEKSNSSLKFELELRSNGLTPPFKFICAKIMAFLHEQNIIFQYIFEKFLLKYSLKHTLP